MFYSCQNTAYSTTNRNNRVERPAFGFALTNVASTQAHILAVSIIAPSTETTIALALGQIPHICSFLYQHLHLLLHFNRLILVA